MVEHLIHVMYQLLSYTESSWTGSASSC